MFYWLVKELGFRLERRSSDSFRAGAVGCRAAAAFASVGRIVSVCRVSRLNEFLSCPPNLHLPPTLQVFDCMPLCALIQEKIFVVHGGLFSR